MRDAIVLTIQVSGAAAALLLPPHLVAWAVIAWLEVRRALPVTRETPEEDPDELPLRERQ